MIHISIYVILDNVILLIFIYKIHFIIIIQSYLHDIVYYFYN